MTRWERYAYVPIVIFGLLLMIEPLILDENSPARCKGCHGDVVQPFAFSMTFRPIIEVKAGRPYADETLARGLREEPSGSVLSKATNENRHAFHQDCGVRALTLTAQLGLADPGAQLSINFMPGIVYIPAACIQRTLKTAREAGFSIDRIVFEIAESEQVKDVGHLRPIVKDYRERRFLPE